MTNKQNKYPSKFDCDVCAFVTSNKKDYNRHILTAKHIRMTNSDNNYPLPNEPHTCECGKIYKYRQGLFTHRKKCNTSQLLFNTKEGSLNENSHMDTTLVIELLKQNQEFKDLMFEQAKQLVEQQQEQNNKLIEQNKHILDQNEKITELAKNAGSVTNHNTTNNTTNKFNLNVFLNETCKDAITMNEFINSVEVTMEDFIRTGEIGFVDGISTVMVERIKGMEMHTRPMHCTDLKRETMYIKNDNAWEKGDTDKTLLRRAVKNIANKNYRQLKPWFDSSQPEVDQIGTDEYENYFQYYRSALGGCGKEEDRKFEDKIIKNVLKEIVVDK